MTSTLRRVAVSGSAAVAVLGGAATLTVAAPAPASAAATQHVVERAVTAPVTLPDGRTMRITGMGGYGHHATDTQIATVAGFKADTEPGSGDGITNGLTPDSGSGSQLVNPQQQMPAGTQQQYQTQAGGGVIATGVVAIMLFAIIAVFRIKKRDAKVGDAVLFTFLGVALGGTVIGGMISQMTASGVTSLGGIFSSLG
ncbi:hypothetical protein KVH30_02180 [Streptomyces olivaceus]|uniref:hypothetical protein n=1 Tax=Streptomyces olivaceus TaxID=47716 RepID=UPI001CCB226C|nr:hypothetical protein [Streptomyces olivaceus]MBZ6290380.1 hypothetical protein [Streptomyces olivaceus]MBZ6324332.1 hypothetical protein [Streptomyces olivaceus]